MASHAASPEFITLMLPFRACEESPAEGGTGLCGAKGGHTGPPLRSVREREVR